MARHSSNQFSTITIRGCGCSPESLVWRKRSPSGVTSSGGDAIDITTGTRLFPFQMISVRDYITAQFTKP